MKVQIELTNNCNLECKGCLRENMVREKGFITVKTFLKSLTLCLDFGVEEVILHHLGEPLLHKDLLLFIELVKLCDLKVGFTTNGDLLTHDKIREFKESGLDKLNISYNTNRSSHRRMMLKTFYRISKGLGIETYFRCVVFSKEEYENIKDELHGYDAVLQRGIYFDKSKNSCKICKALEILFVIQWDGKVVPCCAIYDDRQYSYGEIGKLTVDELKLEMNELRLMIGYNDKKLENCCNHCFEVDDVLPIAFKL